AEDGIGDLHVTGVQTCALPIYHVRDAARRAAVTMSPPGRPALSGLFGTVVQQRLEILIQLLQRGLDMVAPLADPCDLLCQPVAGDRKSVVEVKRQELGALGKLR